MTNHLVLEDYSIFFNIMRAIWAEIKSYIHTRISDLWAVISFILHSVFNNLLRGR